MLGGLMSTMVKHWSVTSRCHRFTRRSSALMNVSCATPPGCHLPSHK